MTFVPRLIDRAGGRLAGRPAAGANPHDARPGRADSSTEECVVDVIFSGPTVTCARVRRDRCPSVSCGAPLRVRSVKPNCLRSGDRKRRSSVGLPKANALSDDSAANPPVFKVRVSGTSPGGVAAGELSMFQRMFE